MASNIELLLHRGEQLQSLEEKTSAVAKLSVAFQAKAKDAMRFQMWQQVRERERAKGTADTAARGGCGSR